jgi:hypothetical protein
MWMKPDHDQSCQIYQQSQSWQNDLDEKIHASSKKEENF